VLCAQTRHSPHVGREVADVEALAGHGHGGRSVVGESRGVCSTVWMGRRRRRARHAGSAQRGAPCRAQLSLAVGGART
jgi:hypothetical protein